ncbi:MAG: Fic family protein [Lachnospiraceae bacterium]|nr:Fic family protein [Lachnospiraceae bacterium]
MLSYRKNSITTSFEPAKVDDIIETINHFEAVRHIIDHIEDDLTPIFIQHLHQILTYGTYADRKAKLQPGVLRTDDFKKGIVPAKISKELTSLCKTYEKNPATIERILEFHVRFEKIHPFKDYNGRIGRLIMMKECLRFSITPFIIDDKNRALYRYGILA